jgi:TonB-linked SusC/RagA family outer membrane protein
MKKKILQLLFLFAVVATSAMAQKTVTGVVKDDSGDPMPGVNVIVAGTTNGTITDTNGKYSIQVPNKNTVLHFSFIGMEAQDVPVAGKSVINVVLKASAVGLDEVVVTSLGLSREKKSLGYSVAEVSGDEMQKVAQENVLNSLSGKVAGVQVSSVGVPGSSVSMVIRGASSLTTDNQPLFVVDGIPMNNTLNNVTEMARDTKVDYGNAISDLNADDIESVTVLKGPSAAALYGSRAGNGVVIITTKSGKKSKGVGVTVTSNTVFDNPYKYLPMHDLFANGNRPYTQDNRPNNGLPYMIIDPTKSGWVGPELDKGMMAYQWPYFDENGDMVARELVSHPDNRKEFFNTGVTSTNTVSIANVTEKIDYRLSYTNMVNKGVVPNSDLHKNSISMNSTINIVKDLKISSVLNYTNSSANNRPSLGNRGANPLQYLYDLNSHIDINDLKNYWAPGLEGLEQNAPYEFKGFDDAGNVIKGDIMNNPYFIANEVNNPFDRNRFYGNAKLDWQIAKNWSAFVRYNIDNLDEVRETKIAPSYSKEPNGFYGIVNLKSREQNADFLLTYNTKVSDFSINASFGGNYRNSYNASHLTQTKCGGKGLIIPNVFTVSNIANDNLTYSSGYSKKLVYSLYALASFGFKDALYLDLTARNDWSSTLPESNRSYFYPSASLSMLVNNIVDLGSSVSMLKLRGGWAQVGNDTNPYMLMTTMSNYGSWGSQPQLGLPGSILLPNLKPELQTSWEVGADMSLFLNRLRFEGTYYKSENENQILPIGMAPSTGYSSRRINAGLISSRGIELSLGGTVIKSQDWQWDVTTIFSRNRTKIDELTEGYNYIRLWTDAKGGAVTRIGDDIGQLVDRKLVRVEDPTSEYYGWPLLDDEGWENSEKWEHLIDDPDSELPVIGNFNPDFNMGFQTIITFKRWTLSASLDWRKGGQFVSQTFRYGESDLHSKRWMDRTLKLNDMSGTEMAQWLREHQDEYLSPDGEFFVLVGGPTKEYGGLEHTEGGITLNDGVFMPGVYGHYDANGKFVMEQEFLGEGNPTIRYQDYYGWSYMRNATFDADFVKLRDLSITYQLPRIKGIQNASVSLYTRNLIVWTKAGINIDPETAFQAESGTQGSGIQFKQGIERYNVAPWTFPIGIKLNLSF